MNKIKFLSGPLRKIIDRVSNSGLNNSVSASLKKRIVLSNQLSGTIGLITFPYIFIFGLVGSKLLSLMVILIVGAFALVPFLNRAGYFIASRMLFCLTPNFAVTVYAACVGKEAGIHLYYFVNICLPLVLFEYRHKKLIAVLSAVPLLLYAILSLFVFPNGAFIVLPDHYLPFIYESLVLSTFASLLAGLWYLYIANYRSEEQLGRLVVDLEKARDEAQAANKAKSQFLAAMSHEIRTPIGVILGYAEILSLRNKYKTSAAHEIDSIIKSGNHLLSLVSNILNIASIEAGRVETKMADFSIREEFGSVIRQFLEQADSNGLKLGLNIDELVPETMNSDQVKIRQILINLIGNALKFTEKGKITVSVGVTKKGGHKWLRAVISDTGIGISPALHGRLFLPFSQGDPTLDRRFGGTGLGLYLSKKMALILGGKLELEKSEVGVGSVFVLLLPIEPGGIQNCGSHQEEDISSHEPQSNIPREKFLAGKKILVVEDNQDNQFLIAELLQELGATLIQVYDGSEAINVVQKNSENPVDLIIMDIQLPGVNGIAATEKIRQLGYTMPIICLTAHALDRDRDMALNAGCNEFLTKPINREKLSQSLWDNFFDAATQTRS